MGEMPEIDVVIPVLNEALHIERCIESVRLSLNPIGRGRVIVVDNGSTDESGDIARALGAEVIDVPNVNVGAVRNAGAARSDSEFIAFMDGDCVAADKWLLSALTMLSDKDIGAVGAPCTVPMNASWVERAWVGKTRSERTKVLRLAGPGIVMRRDLFDAIDGFNESLVAGEDDDLSNRIRSRGKRLVEMPDCTVIHLDYPKSLIAIFLRQVWHGSASIDLFRASGLTLMLVASVLFLVSALSSITFLIIGGSPTWSAAAFLPGFFVCIGKATATVRKRKDRYIQIVPLSIIYLFFFAGRGVGFANALRTLLFRDPNAQST